jgi:iron-sulfur cluster repair protein YtfE (RIC family)
MSDPDLPELEVREGLPDALRILLKDYPRDAWEADPAFSQLIRFWLDRHLMFRRLLAGLTTDTEAALNANLDIPDYANRLSRLGSHFLQHLHGHHQIEDAHYFPRLVTLDDRLTRGFRILDRDHHAIDGHLSIFADEANSVLTRATAPKAPMAELEALRLGLLRMTGFLDRHLTDEEELIVPVLLKYQPEGLA